RAAGRAAWVVESPDRYAVGPGGKHGAGAPRPGDQEVCRFSAGTGRTPMSPSQHSPAKAIGAAGLPMDELEEVAADWIARRNGGAWSPAAQAELDTWLATSPRYAQAFKEMETAWALLNEPRLAGRAETVSTQIDQRLGRRRRAWT